MSFGISVQRTIGDAHVVFTATLTTADEALSVATRLATDRATATTPKEQPAATGKKTQTAEASAKASQEQPTPDASSSSDSSLTASENANKPGDKAEAPPALDYEKDIKPLVLAIAKISREKAEGLLQRFGVASAKNLKADQFADFKELADKVIAGEYDPTASDKGALA